MSAMICLFQTEQPIMCARHLDLCTQYSDYNLNLAHRKSIHKFQIIHQTGMQKDLIFLVNSKFLH